MKIIQPINKLIKTQKGWVGGGQGEEVGQEVASVSQVGGGGGKLGGQVCQDTN